MFGFRRKGEARAGPIADPPYVPGPRALQTGSFVELAARLKALDTPLRATAYAIGDRIIISQSVGVGPELEVGEPIVLTTDIDDEHLGRAICDQLLAFRRGPLPDMRDRKLTDWAAYRASGARSIKQFEAKGYRISLRTVGDSIRLEAAPITSLHEAIGVAAIAPPDHADGGARCRRVLKGAAALRDSGIV